MIGSLAVSNKQKALADLDSMSDQLVALAERMTALRFYVAKEHIEAAWRCVQYAGEVIKH